MPQTTVPKPPRDPADGHLLAMQSRFELDEQLRFERLITEISTLLMHIPAEAVDRQIVTALGRVAQFLGFQVAAYSLLTGNATGAMSYVWNEPGGPAMPSTLTEKDFPWQTRQLSAGLSVSIGSLADFPPEAAADRATYERYGMTSSLDVPLIVGGHVVGAFSVGSFSSGHSVSPQIAQRQRILGDIFVSAITRAQAESSLRESERRLALAVTGADLGLWSWNLSNHGIWATDRTRSMFGLAPHAAPTVHEFLAVIHPDSRAIVDAAIADALTQHRAYACEYRIIRPDGEVRWIAARGEPAFDENGAATTMTGIVQDITERRTTELETLALRRDLAHAARVTLLGQLSSALAHELSQPLGAILRNAEAAELLLQEAVPDLEELRAIVTDIRRDDQRGADVINRLRSLLKRRDLELLDIDLPTLIREVVALIRPDALVREIQLHVDTLADLPAVRGDRVHLQQVLLNLIINAMDALAEADPATRRILIGVTRTAADELEVQVRDHGPGIASERLAHVFEPFFTTKDHGMGMGLPVSKTIIDAHRGRIWAENHPAGGALFRFTIPIARDTATA